MKTRKPLITKSVCNGLNIILNNITLPCNIAINDDVKNALVYMSKVADLLQDEFYLNKRMDINKKVKESKLKRKLKLKNKEE
jgi:hypothetical protein